MMADRTGDPYSAVVTNVLDRHDYLDKIDSTSSESSNGPYLNLGPVTIGDCELIGPAIGEPNIFDLDSNNIHDISSCDSTACTHTDPVIGELDITSTKMKLLQPLISWERNTSNLGPNSPPRETKHEQSYPRRNSRPCLPPCRVCEAPASGLHYGVNTCEACKSFYKRCIRRGGKPDERCTKGNICIVRHNTRQSCSECRYAKCVNLGMSKKAVRTGRYTHAMKARNIMEVKGIPAAVKSHHSKVTQTPLECLDTASPMQETIGNILRTHDHIMKIFQHNTSTELRIQSPLQDLVTELGNSDGADEKTQNIRVLGVIIKNMENIICHLVMFAKSVPGFSKLPMVDQEKMIKAARMPFFVMSQYKTYNMQRHEYISSVGERIRLQPLSRIDQKTREYHNTVLRIVTPIYKMEFDPAEEAMIIALSLTYPEYPIKNTVAVDSMQQHIMDCLRYMLRQKRSDSEMRYAKIISSITGLKEMNYINEQLYKNVDYLKIMANESPLFMEVLDEDN